MPRARLIVRYGIGVDNVDLVAARDRGIPVCNVPAYCIDEVADHDLALLLDATRRVSANGRVVRDGGWGLAVPLDRMKCLRELTVGIDQDLNITLTGWAKPVFDGVLVPEFLEELEQI